MFSSFNHWPAIAAQIIPGAKLAVTTTALTIEQAAASGAPVEKGFLSSSVYSVTPDYQSTYGGALAPSGDSYLFPPAIPADDMSAVVGVAASYGEWVNYGHHVKQTGTWVPANPFFDLAVEIGRQVLDIELAKLGAGLGGSIR